MKKLLLIFSLFFIQFSFDRISFSGGGALKAQIINTFAGDGYYAGSLMGGYSGDGGPATAAEFDHPVDIVFDKTWNLYITDRNNSVVRMVDTSGIITTIAGNGVRGFSGDGGPATAAEFNDAAGVLIDSLGNMYITDHDNERIRKINTGGIIKTIAGNGIAGYTGDGGPATIAEVNIPGFMAMDNSGNLFFADVSNDVIRMINTSGIISTAAGNHLMGYSGDGGPASAAELNAPEGVTFDKNGNSFIADDENQVVREVNTSGIISTIAGIHWRGYSGDGGPATAAELDQPCSITFDAYGNMYIADEGNSVIRMIDSAGIITTIAGNGTQGYSGDGGPATAAEMYGASVVEFDASGNMFLADEYNNVIREVKGLPNGINQIRASNFQFSIFPNPVNQTLNLKFNGQITGLATLTIMDITGKVVLSQSMVTNTLQIDVSSLSPGMYFICIKNKDIPITQKFIKQ
jgi:trimeric autotransporter adhesin